MLVQAFVSILLLIILLALSIPTISKLFEISTLISFVVSPLLLITWTAFFHNVLVVLGRTTNHAVFYANTSKISIIIWALFSVGFLIRTPISPSINRNRFAATRLLPLITVVALSLSAWTFGIGSKILSPADNDALSNAFISSRMLTQKNQFLCTVANDATLDINLRFESCGSFVLTHTSNIFGLLTNDQAITLSYLLVSIFLPLGAAAAWRSLGGKSSEAWIASMSSVLFLIYPYALNGLLRLSLSLVFLLPISSLVVSDREASKSHLLLLSIALVGLGYIHLLTLTIVIVFFGLTAVTAFIRSINIHSFFVSFRVGSQSLIWKIGALMPVYLIFYNSKSVRSSVDGVFSATAHGAIAPPTFQLDGEISRQEDWILQAFENIFGLTAEIVRNIIFETEWTRPQPILVCLVLTGMGLAIRKKLDFPYIYSAIISALFALLILTELSGRDFLIFRVLFLNEWYRLLAVLQVFCVIPMAYAISFILGRIRKKRYRRLYLTFLAMILFISLGTGASIIRTAWKRERPHSVEILKTLDEIRPWTKLRTLNDPSDGSAWAFSRIGFNISFPNDRGEFLEKGKVVTSVLSESDAKKFYSLAAAEDAVAVIGIGKSVQSVRGLDDYGLIREWLINKDNLVLGLLNR